MSQSTILWFCQKLFMLVIFVHSIKLNAQKLWEKLVIQLATPYWNLTSKLLSQKCCRSNFVKKNFFVSTKSRARFQCACNICAKFQIDCHKTLGEADYTILLPHTEVWPKKHLSRTCHNCVKNYFFLWKKKTMHNLNILITYLHSFKSIAWKLLQELITQTCYHILKPYRNIVKSQKCWNFVKKFNFIFKHSHTDLQ